MSNFNSAKTVLIVGAGNFGAATALYLARHHKDKTVTLIDRTDSANPCAASHDINKIVRDEYTDPLYMRLMLEAMPMWRSDELYSPFFHQVGMLRADPTGYGEGSLRSYQALGAETSAVWLSVEEVRRRWNGVFADAHFGDLERIMFNPGSGWAEADHALKAVLQAARGEGARYRKGVVGKLEFDPEGKCAGVLLDSGDRLAADVVLLCAGARTAELLAASQPGRPEFHLGHRVVATGAMSFAGTLKGAQKERFRDIPVCKNVVEGVKGESMSMTPDGVIKFNCDMGFTNMQHHEASHQKMSITPDEAMYGTWQEEAFSDKFKTRALSTMKGLYGKEMDGVEIESYRMCWDAVTPTHDFLITQHAQSANLYIATGGSFHGWKFLPVIGKYIVKMMEDTLDVEFVRRWGWDVDDDHLRANPTYDTEFDLPVYM
ncbi:sarcosine oxidase [Sodiomyces alkalinus F11]|uniref:Sarcosine oxidase n=1 Tax=Sodiomyces alkalinus (strain CBS 110278 / VKM F-3762 / F11) TaxID=1314773 RepID=A0A3N2PPY1_SODAK|nr:sarcosine oxidase [Sodiomyces alkalinus F11]ROT36572.1 sarcosine oxidase [Sodiomyces alkalinus F11]